MCSLDMQVEFKGETQVGDVHVGLQVTKLDGESVYGAVGLNPAKV